MNNLLKKLTPPEPLGQCDSNFIGMFQTVRFIQMMSLTFGLFTQVSGSGPLGPLVRNIRVMVSNTYDYYGSLIIIKALIIYISIKHPLNCMFSGHLIQRSVSK